MEVVEVGKLRDNSRGRDGGLGVLLSKTSVVEPRNSYELQGTLSGIFFEVS